MVDIPDGCPRYRVRLFLAADLSNSTSYKSVRPPRDWVPTFREFYSDFSSLFKRKHLLTIERLGKAEPKIDLSSLTARPPRFWKTVGDEIIFVNQVDSCHEVCLLVMAFTEALTEYLNDLKSDPKKSALGIKGSGWVASFPYPNIAINKPTLDSGDEPDLSESEEIESSADQDPNLHEFLGKGLDYGFRISKNSADNFLALSPALANILVRPSVNADYAGLGMQIRVLPPVAMKGVLNGLDYPAVGVPIDKSSEWMELRKTQERLLSGDQSNDKDIRDYLAGFIKLHEIEEPALKTRPDEADPPLPAYYLEKYVKDWKGSAKEVDDQEAILSEGTAEDGEEEVGKSVFDEMLKIFKGLDGTP